MANRFQGRGNLGSEPTLRQVEVDGETSTLCMLRVYFDRQVPVDDGGYADRGGFWLDVSLWGERAPRVAQLLEKGARISVNGVLVEKAWSDKETGEDRSKLEVRANDVDLDLLGVAEVLWQRTTKWEEAGEPA